MINPTKFTLIIPFRNEQFPRLLHRSIILRRREVSDRFSVKIRTLCSFFRILSIRNSRLLILNPVTLSYFGGGLGDRLPGRGLEVSSLNAVVKPFRWSSMTGFGCGVRFNPFNVDVSPASPLRDEPFRR